jgi:hypothetical protein
MITGEPARRAGSAASRREAHAGLRKRQSRSTSEFLPVFDSPGLVEPPLTLPSPPKTGARVMGRSHPLHRLLTMRIGSVARESRRCRHDTPRCIITAGVWDGSSSVLLAAACRLSFTMKSAVCADPEVSPERPAQ